MNNLEPLRRRLRRIEFHMEPVDPTLPTAVSGPLEVVGGPIRSVEMVWETAFDLELDLEPDTDPVAVTGAAIALLMDIDQHSRLNGGGGLTIDTKRSRSMPGRVFLRIVPNDIRTADICTQSRTIPGVKESRVHPIAA
jgi:hypothetical protein